VIKKPKEIKKDIVKAPPKTQKNEKKNSSSGSKMAGARRNFKSAISKTQDSKPKEINSDFYYLLSVFIQSFSCILSYKLRLRR